MLAFSIGTRAELIKVFPVMRELDDYFFIHTGQHDLGNLISLFDIKEPDITLSPPPQKSTKFYFNTPKAIAWNLGMVNRIKKVVKEQGVTLLAYHGDTMSTASSALASKLSGISGAHLEAGLRSGFLFEPFPEEISRRMADKFSKLLFAVSEKTASTLRKSKGTVLPVGNTIVDSAKYAYKLGEDVETPENDYAIITTHRQENLRNRERMQKIVEMIKEIPIDAYFFIHDNTLLSLKRFGLLGTVKRKAKLVRITSYPAFIKWLANSRILLTDGGSIQEESLVFKKPCLILRNRTERNEGLDTGLNFLTKFNVNYAKAVLDEVLNDDWKTPSFKNPYGERGVSKKVAKEMIKYINNY